MIGVSSFENNRGIPVKSIINLNKWKSDDESSEESASEEYNSPSYVCLLVPKISRSSIFREPFYHFPEIDNPYLDIALWGMDQKLKPDNVGTLIYLRECKDGAVIPLRRVLNNLDWDTLDLKFFNLNDKEMKAICTALLTNNYVATFILEENHLSLKSIEHLVSVIVTNKTINCLNLKHCSIGYFGAKVFGNCFKSNSDIVELDLSFNNLNDGVEFLSDGLRLNAGIKILNLSHNNLGDRAMMALKCILEDNYSLTNLDLSWNVIYGPLGMKELMEGLAENVSVENLNLAWNGIGDKETVKKIMIFLKSEQAVLKHLDLSHNRITGEIPVRMLIAGLKACESLLTVRLGGNPLLPDEVETIALIAKDTNLKTLDFGDTWINKSFLPIRNRLRKKGCQVIHGSIYSNYRIKGPNVKEMLLKRAKYVAMKQKKKKLKKDFGHWLLALKGDIVTAEAFESMAKAAKIKLDRDLLAMIGKTFGKGEEKIMSINEVRDVYMKLYPDTKLPEKKKKKEKKKKRKKTLV